MTGIFILFSMFFLHIVDDYYLQGKLANFKQKVWWQENAPKKLYRYDYIVALVMHSFSWSFMTMLPIAYANEFAVGVPFALVLIINSVVHGVTDHIKANLLKINLICDQSIHIAQIMITWLLFV